MLFNVPSVLATLTGDGRPTWFGGMFKLLMASGRLMKIPAILLDKFDQIAKFQ
jgi:hypothetical protein